MGGFSNNSNRIENGSSNNITVGEIKGGSYGTISGSGASSSTPNIIVSGGSINTSTIINDKEYLVLGSFVKSKEKKNPNNY